MNGERQTLVNARLLCAASGFDHNGGLVIENGCIADIGPQISVGDNVIDCAGKTLIPGMIDGRVHLSDPGYHHRETLLQTLKAAVRGGVTSILVLPNTLPVLDSVANIHALIQTACQAGLAKVYPYAALSQACAGDTLSEMGLLAEAGAVALTDGQYPVASSRLMAQAMSYAQAHKLPVANICMDPELGQGDMNAGLLATRLGLRGSASMAEEIMLARDLRILQHLGGHYHASMVTTRGAVELVARYKAKGHKVTAGTSINHIMLNELAVEGYRTFAKVWPPLRSEDDRLAIIEGVANGTIDIVVSDHCPVDSDTKRVPFAQADAGMVGLETFLPLCLAPLHSGQLSLHRWLESVTCKPADIFGIEGGKLAKGMPADLALIDIDAPVVVSDTQLSTPCRNLSYEQLPAQGKVIKTWVAGSCVYDSTLPAEVQAQTS